MTKYILLKAFHPKKFERGVYAVSFRKRGKPLVDRNVKFTMVIAKNRMVAIRKSRKQLRI